MAAGTGTLSHRQDWKDLYVAALLEGDKDKIPSRIDQAERAIVERTRELFKRAADNTREQESLQDALYALQALKNCMATHGRLAQAA